MLVVVLAAMVDTGLLLMVLVVLVMVLIVLIVLKRLAEIHLHGVVLLAAPAIHHDVVGLVPVALIEHAELLRRRPDGGSRGGGSIGVTEGYAAASSGRPHSVGEISYALCVLRVEGLASSPLVDRVLGHLRELRREIWRVPGVAADTEDESPGTIWRERASGRRKGSGTRLSSL